MTSDFLASDRCGSELDMFTPTASVGDFYCEPTDVTRGLTLSLGDLAGVQHFKDSATSGQRFQRTDVPRTLSLEAASCLSPTTIHISGSPPSEIGNALLELLQGSAHVCKVRRDKFSIKASICVDGLQCEIKLRFYNHCGICTVELQRYSGDGVAFWRFYCQANAYLKSFGGCVSNVVQNA